VSYGEIFFKLVSTTISRSLLWMFSHDGCIILLYLSTWPSVDPALVFDSDDGCAEAVQCLL
jgi:hypothetical protein